jgi:putative transposase
VSTPRRPGRLGVGDRVRSGGVVRTVVGVSGTLLRLADVDGKVMAVPLAVLQAVGDFALIDVPHRRPLPAAGLLDGLPDEAVEQALWWSGTSWRSCTAWDRTPRRGRAAAGV